MEKKIKNLFNTGTALLSGIDPSVDMNYKSINDRFIDENDCNIINGWMLSYKLSKDVEAKSIVNRLCLICENIGVEYHLSIYIDKNNMKIKIWVDNNEEIAVNGARRVFKWDERNIQISNSLSHLNLDSNEFIEAIKYNDIQILSVFPPQLN